MAMMAPRDEMAPKFSFFFDGKTLVERGTDEET